MKKAVSISIFLFISFVAIANSSAYIEKDDVSIYPIPANKHFTIEVPESYSNGKISITNMVGKVVKLILLEEELKVKVLTDELTKGIYFVSIQVNTEMVFTKRIVIDK